MSDFLFKDRDGQTPLPPDLQKGLKIKTIQTIGELDEFEENNLAAALSWLARQTTDPCKYIFWVKLHKNLFKRVWTWAGKIRTHELANPDFKDPHEIWPELFLLEKDLEYWISSPSFSNQEMSARFHERIETIHPFANGNGRFGRILTEQICRYHNHNIPTWGAKLNNDPVARRKSYIDALVEARRRGDYNSLISLMFS